MARSKRKRAILEQGNIYFLYRPKVNVDEAKGFEDVQRLHVVLHPARKEGIQAADDRTKAVALRP